ncbi:MAG: AI-2E family transporter [Muribaculaceae bacterium]|nr:AI-2E family transporter [Muribaculaceae bacterium]
MAFLDSRPYTFDRVVRILFSVALAAAVVYLLDLLKGVLLPFCVACLIAYMLEPIVQFNRRFLHTKGRVIAIALTLLEVLIVVGALGYFFIPSIIKELHQMGDLVTRYADSGELRIPFLPDSFHDLIRSHFDLRKFANELSSHDLQTILDKGVDLISNSVNVIISILAWFIVFLYVIFIMADYERLMLSFRLMVPPKYRRPAYKIGRDIKASMNHYFRGQALIALIVAVIYAVGFSIVGLPLGIVIGLMNGVLFMVPYFVYVSILPVTLMCIVYSVDQSVDFWTIWLECACVYAVAQIVADIFLTPKIMGKAMGMNPAIILLSLSVWGTLLGFLGMIIALPLTALLISYYEQYVINRRDGTSAKERRLAAKTIEDISEVKS